MMASPVFKPETFSVLDCHNNQLHQETTLISLCSMNHLICSIVLCSWSLNQVLRLVALCW